MRARLAAATAALYALAADVAWARESAGDMNAQIQALFTGPHKAVAFAGAGLVVLILVGLVVLASRSGETVTPEQRVTEKIREVEAPRIRAALGSLDRAKQVLARKGDGRVSEVDRVAGRLQALLASMERASRIEKGVSQPMEYLVEAAENAFAKAEGGNLSLVDDELARVSGWISEIEGKVS